MPLPLAPITAFALRYGTVALATYALARSAELGRRDQRAEDALDDIPEGVTGRRDNEQMNATWRIRRVVRLGKTGPAVEIDASALGRVRLRRV
ncbi:MAG TPA: hypothetical protein ENK63_04170 [Rhodobacterales bacterium]|nr:hypothetical protein [Rhodobacterales bacterium]